MSDTGKNIAERIVCQLSRLSEVEALTALTETFPGQVTFSSSFSVEDQVILHQIASNQLPVSVFTLDTGRLFPETYAVWSSSREKYNISIQPYFPNQESLEQMVEANGPNSFYASVSNRQQCCFIRKVAPLQRALAGNKVWITGLRAAHSPERKNVTSVEWDEGNQVIKYHPLLHWSNEQVWDFIKQHNIPYNPLHDRGFVSIGCAPCTRAIQPGEDFRAGRWWWEDANKKECGLHVAAPSQQS